MASNHGLQTCASTFRVTPVNGLQAPLATRLGLSVC